MIRIIQFGRKISDFPITPSVIASLPNWDEMIEKHRNYTPEVCSVEFPRLSDIIEDPQGSQDLMADNWHQLVNQHILNDYDIAMNKIIVVAKFSATTLESRRLFLEKYRSKPDVYLYMQNFIWLYCPMSLPNNKKEFGNWVIV